MEFVSMQSGIKWILFEEKGALNYFFNKFNWEPFECVLKSRRVRHLHKYIRFANDTFLLFLDILVLSNSQTEGACLSYATPLLLETIVIRRFPSLFLFHKHLIGKVVQTPYVAI